MLSDLISRPCTLLLRSDEGDTDNHGNEIPSENTVETVCELQQGSGSSTAGRSEPADLGEIAETRWTAFFAADSPAAALNTGDAFVVDGETYELVGDPWVVQNPRTRADSHVEVSARRAAGAEEAGS